MRSFILSLSMLSLIGNCNGQIRIEDRDIRHQQERMVFKHWDHFSPFPHRFLGVPTNPLWYLTWAWHPDYPDSDKRPLGPIGPQTQRMALVAALEATDEQYKKEADTLQKTATIELVNYNGTVAAADPLWVLYYRLEFDDLINKSPQEILDALSADKKQYVLAKGIFEVYVVERARLIERLDIARAKNMDRGSRIMSYHRLLGEYRLLRAKWDELIATSNAFQSIALYRKSMRSGRISPPEEGDALTDKELAREAAKKAGDIIK